MNTWQEQTQAQPFWALLSQALAPQEALYNLILGVMERSLKSPTPPLMLHIQTPELECFALRSGQRPLLLATPLPPEEALIQLQPHIPALVQLLRKLSPDLQEIVAPKSLAHAFAKVWCPSESYKVEMEQGVFRLERVQPPARPAPGQLRQAQLSDLEQLMSWQEAFVRESLPHEFQAGDDFRAAAQAQIEAGRSFVWQHGNTLVSMAAKIRQTPHGTAISQVYTPPEQRGRGYASACVAALSQVILDEGKDFCCLFTDLSNPTSNHIYQQIGYVQVGEFAHLSWPY